MKNLIKMVSILLSVMVFIGSAGGCVISSGSGNIVGKEKRRTTYNLEEVSVELTKGNKDFAFNIFRQINLEDENINTFISPLSISTALTMTYNGARNNTAKTMAESLQYKDMGIEKLNTGYKNLLSYLNHIDPKVELDINNSIWFKKGEELEPDFLSLNKESFDAYISEMDFQDPKAADTINNWVDKATKGKIDKIIEPPISLDIIMYLINAIYFKGQWTEQFDKKLTFTGTFYKEDGEKQEVQMMSRGGTIEYGQFDNTKIIRLPYGNEKTAMYCILPEQGVKINDYIKELDTKNWNDLKDSISKRSEVVLQLPRFKFEYGIKDLSNSLIALGMGEAFSDSADFSGIRDDVCISRVLHKAVIEVNEEGSEAAAVTAVELKTTSAAKPTMFIADRPFIFLIEDKETETILFMGKLLEI